MAESARGQPTPNGMGGRHGSFERAQSSRGAGRAPGSAGACGQLGARQWGEKAVEIDITIEKRPAEFISEGGAAGYTVMV